MRFQSGHAEVQAEGFGQTAAFTIAASGKAFKGLIDGLYSRKVEAVIRELATNAFDAHKAADSIAPFTVHLPTALRPTFWLRDFGTGMSHDLMMRRYTTMFDSTKDGLNEEDDHITPDDQVGMLGLGSKAFFAYTDSCTITVWMAGEVRFYTVFMGPDGIPQIALAGAEPSDEPVGVKVEFAVKPKDFAEFEKAAVRVFKGFPGAPDGLLPGVKEKIAVEPHQIGSFWKSYEKDYLPKSGIWARQGCVLYPIDLEQIDDRAVEKEETVWEYDMNAGHSLRKTKMVPVLSEKFKRFEKLDITIVIDFPIGSLEFDLSRERLAYTDRTILSLRNRWADFITDLDAVFDDRFKPLNRWERMELCRSKEFSELGILFISTSWNMDALELFYALHDEFNHRDADNNYIEGRLKNALVNFGQRDPYPLRSQKSFDSSVDHHGGLGRSIVIVIDEEKPSAINKRTLHYLKTNDLAWAFTIRPGDESPALLEKLGNPTVVKSSELPKAPRLPGQPKGEGPPPFERIKVINDNGSSYDGAESEEDYEDHLFCFLNKGRVYNPDPERYPNLSVDDVMNMHVTLRYFTGQSISFINIKSNEFTKLDRWADYPLFYGCLDGIRDMIGPKDLRDLVNIINYDRYDNSKYESAAKAWRSVFKNATDPLAQMERFRWRFNRIDRKRLNNLRRFIDGDSLKPFVDEIVDRGKAAGLEVLPPMQERTFRQPAIYPYPLLPKPWEELVKVLNQQHFNKNINRLVFTSLKEKLGC